MPGCLAGRSQGARAASSGPMRHVLGAPGGGSGPNVCGLLMVVPPLDSHQRSVILVSVFDRVGVHLGSLLGAMVAPFSSQVGPGTVFIESHCLII